MDTTAPQLDPRTERALAEEVLCEGALRLRGHGRDAAPRASASPYVVPMNFAYVPAAPSTAAAGRPGTRPGRVYLHTGAGERPALG